MTAGRSASILRHILEIISRNAASGSAPGVGSRSGDFFMCGTVEIPQHFDVQRGFVAEVIIDCRDIDPGARADIPYGGGLKSVLGKDLPGGVHNLLPCRIDDRPQ